jgi:hypothetical protein
MPIGPLAYRGLMLEVSKLPQGLLAGKQHCEAEFTKRWIVHPLIGNVSWVELPSFAFQPNALQSHLTWSPIKKTR